MNRQHIRYYIQVKIKISWESSIESQIRAPGSTPLRYPAQVCPARVVAHLDGTH